MSLTLIPNFPSLALEFEGVGVTTLYFEVRRPQGAMPCQSGDRGKRSWRLKFDVERKDGARQIRYVTVKGTKKDAEAELARLLNDAHRER